MAVNKSYGLLQRNANYVATKTFKVKTRREFVYLIEEKKLFGENKFIHGNSRVSHDNYNFDFDDSNRKFWLEEKVYEPRAFDRDSLLARCSTILLRGRRAKFIQTQDSITHYHSSEEYLKEQDSIYNSLYSLGFSFNGVGFRNTFKSNHFGFPALSTVSTHLEWEDRYNVDFEYEKEFKNGHAIEVRPFVDYGRNRDLKGRNGLFIRSAPVCKNVLSKGDTYDLWIRTLSPANRVRNRLVELNHEFEITNGLYLRTGIEASLRQALTNVVYPDWVEVFGDFRH